MGKKREQFTRFYFLSNSELLNIISTVKNIFDLIPFLKKLFDNIVDMDMVGNRCNHLISLEGERLFVKNLVFRVGEIEDMLQQIMDVM